MIAINYPIVASLRAIFLRKKKRNILSNRLVTLFSEETLFSSKIVKTKDFVDDLIPMTAIDNGNLFYRRISL